MAATYLPSKLKSSHRKGNPGAASSRRRIVDSCQASDGGEREFTERFVRFKESQERASTNVSRSRLRFGGYSAAFLIKAIAGETCSASSMATWAARRFLSASVTRR